MVGGGGPGFQDIVMVSAGCQDIVVIIVAVAVGCSGGSGPGNQDMVIVVGPGYQEVAIINPGYQDMVIRFAGGCCYCYHHWFWSWLPGHYCYHCCCYC